jgi:hypothetical protein
MHHLQLLSRNKCLWGHLAQRSYNAIYRRIRSLLPMRTVLPSSAVPAAPISMLSLPAKMLIPAFMPMPKTSVVLSPRAENSSAVLLEPVLMERASPPAAVFS